MRRVSFKEATEDLASLAKAARDGEEVVITAEDGGTLRLVFDADAATVGSAEIPPFRREIRIDPAMFGSNTQGREDRPIGLLKGQVRISDDFDAPLPATEDVTGGSPRDRKRTI